MKKILLSLAVIIFTAAATSGQHRVIAVGFYNVENFFDTVDDPAKADEDFTPNGAFHYTEKIYQKKLTNIATVLQKLGTDVTPEGATFIGIAEIENDRVLNDLVSQPEIKDRGYKYVWFPTPDVRGISTAFIYYPKNFKVISAEPVHVPLEKLRQNRPTRNILFIKGVLSGNDTVHVLVNHWPSRSGGEEATKPYRNLAASVDKQIADSVLAVNPNAKIFIMGDLNDNPVDESVTKILKAKADTVDMSLTDIYNPWIKIYKKRIGTEVFNGEWNLLDQIMISGGVIKNNNGKWKYLRNKIFNKEFLSHEGHPRRSFDIDKNWDNGFSDHYPVLVYLYW